MSFDKVEVAAAVRDAIQAVAQRAVAQGAPRPNFGRVISVNFVAQTAMVWFPGDAAPVSVNLLNSTLPGDWQDKYPNDTSTSYVGKGSVVAVETFNGKQYITAVLSGGQFAFDFKSSGIQSVAYGFDNDPADPTSSDYVFNIQWPTTTDADGTLPNYFWNGGPYAINIGPLVYNGGPANNPNGTIEFDVALNSSVTKSYKFNFDSSIFTNNFFVNGSVDNWFRVVAERTDNQNSFVTGRSINWFITADWKQGLGDWVAGTNCTFTLDPTIVDQNSLGSPKLISTNAAQVTIEAKTNSYTHIQVIPNASYAGQFYVRSTATWSDVRFAVDWYTSAGALISSTLPTAQSITAANTWQFMTFSLGTAPATAAYAIPRLRVGSTPPTSQSFWFDNYEMTSGDASVQEDFDVDLGLRVTGHGASDGNSQNSPGEFWMRIYIHWLNGLMFPHFNVRLRNSHMWNSPKSLYTKRPVYEYVSAPPAPVGFVGYTDSFAGYTHNPTSYRANQDNIVSSGPWRNPDLWLGRRAQQVLTGGGNITWDGTNLKWSLPFEIGGIGKSRAGLTNYYALLTMPTSGSIPIYPAGSAVATASSSGIPLAAGQSLWFGIPPGCGSTIPNATYFNGTASTTGGLFVLDNNNTFWWSPPEWAVLIAYRQVNDSTGFPIKLGTGLFLDKWTKPSLQSNFTNGTPNLQYRKIWPNMVKLHGVVVSGATTGSGTTFVSLPSGYRPASGLTIPIQNISSGANAWVSIDSATGNIAIHGAWANGNNFAINMDIPLDTV